MNECVWRIVKSKCAKRKRASELERKMSWSIKKSKEMPICNYAVAQFTSNGLKKWSICYRSNGWIIAAEWNITSSKSTALTSARIASAIHDEDYQCPPAICKVSLLAYIFTVYIRILFIFGVASVCLFIHCWCVCTVRTVTDVDVVSHVPCDWTVFNWTVIAEKRKIYVCKTVMRVSAYKSHKMWLLRV